MIGIIPSLSKTFEVMGDFNSKDLIEGKVYIGPEGRVYVYSTTEMRSSPSTGFFPIWNGKKRIITKSSNKKYLNPDVILTDMKSMSEAITPTVAEEIVNHRKRAGNGDPLLPSIVDGDNMFSQCIKGILNVKKFTMVDLIEMAYSPLDERAIQNHYSSLTKITFMRMSKWNVWLDLILHMRYVLTVFKGNEKLITYSHPENVFGIEGHNDIIIGKDDPFKKIVKILIRMEGIGKSSLQSDSVDDYTINNMMTTLNGEKTLSAQLFSRFIHMAGLSYKVDIFEGDDLIFEYKEN